MMTDFVAALSRSDTLLEDFAGASAIAALLVAGLYLPGLV
ncbi:hypothetical protein LX81_00383 [Palleronia aestuarii]|uniref:Uncharacterized protein n=1 Tax=Palleronia aestuarii TaxID=568105 RepID=A0A2W7QDH5_9RHOB|nr:hypothetical protein LX81_00383 [Palleronia aestuarii]